MFDKTTKIQLVLYLESITLGATESRCLESMTEDQIDRLIRLCKVDPDDDESIMPAVQAMYARDEFRATMRVERLKKDRHAASCADFSRLRPDDRSDFVEFVRENRGVFEACGVDDDFAWLDDKELRPSIDFWTGEFGVVFHEIITRLLFGDGDCEFALAANYTYDVETIGPICAHILAAELDYELKRTLFWKYAKARLQ